jgi:hypothetical protein
LAGCSGVDGVEFNGKIFEAVGLSGDQFSKRSEPKTQPRAPLVLPPDPSKLPEPGSAPTPVVADQQWPKDRDAQRLADAEARKQAQQKHCQDGNWKQKAHKDDIGAAQGPHGSCTGSIFSVIGGTLFGSGE